MASSRKGPRVWFPRIGGGLHERIWFAKAGKGTLNDTGIAPPAHIQIQNGTYSLNLSVFDPTGMTQKEAVEAGKETSLYPGYGSQFGAQIWRLANEAQVGDIIFLESENHHLHAVGIISGEFLPFDYINYTSEVLNTRGIHRIPVKWIPIKDGMDYIQLGRLDNAVFRDVAEKEELATVLIFGTERLVADALGIKFEDHARWVKEELSKITPMVNTETYIESLTATNPSLKIDIEYQYPELTEKNEESEVEVTTDGIEKSSVPELETPEQVIAHVARNGVYIHQNVTEEALHQLIASAKVLPTDHVFHSDIKNWITFAEYCEIKGLSF